MSTIKSWERPWSMEEMIDNSNNWSLAGDVALLSSLQQFADKLLEKTQQTNANIENLTNNLEKANLELNIAQNRFQSLRNTQFIESRVYEDDETLPPVEDNHKKIEDRDEDHTEEISMAISRGLDVLDRYFDKVDVSISDSEGDEDDVDELTRYVLQPKDLYIDRPLPYVIGTEEWHKNWHVGLEDSSDESDTEKISDNYSETDSESTDLQLTFERSQIKSDTSSELDFSKRDSNNKQHQQTIKDDQQSSGSEETKLPINFAQQLAEKLDRVAATNPVIQPEIVPEPEINTRPLQKVPATYGDVFFDEPPPLDVAPTTTTTTKTGLFSGGGGLFDDNDDDDDLWSTQSNQVPRQQTSASKTIERGGLFDHSSSDDDDIFNKKPQAARVLPTVYQQKSPLPVFDDEPPPVEERKKPVGGVSIFGGDDLFTRKLLKRRQESDEDQDGDRDEDKNVEDQRIADNTGNSEEKEEKIVEEPQKKISLFDDDDDMFKDDLFSTNITSKKFTSDLFNDDDNLFKDNDLFVEKSSKSSTFEHPDTTNSINTVKTNDSSKLFETSSNDDLFNDFPNENRETPKTDDITSKLSTIKLFDDDDGDKDNDLFRIDEKQLKKPEISLFDPTPPLDDVNNDNDDDDWATKPDDDDDIYQNIKSSKNLFEDLNDLKPDPHSAPSVSHSILEETPPQLFEEGDDGQQVKTEIQSPPGKLKHNLNINVAALMPGAVAPLKRVEKPPIDNIVSPTTEVKSSDPLNDDGFDTTDRVEVLQSVTKDRAKLPLNRRPSTRRGRKAALISSPKDFKLDSDNTSEVKNNEIIKEIDRASSLFDDTKLDDDFDDLFKTVGEVKGADQSFVVETVTTTKNQPKIVDDLVESHEKPKPVKNKGLFDDDDDDNDENSDGELFKTKKSTVPKKTTKSLFDDDDEDDSDDIFKTTTTSHIRTEIKVATERKLTKSTTTTGGIKKLDPSQPVADPLGIMNLND